jgi:hypothetical protein
MGFLDLIQNGVDGISGLDGARVENNFPVGHLFAGNLESVHDAAPVGEDGRDVLGALKIRHTHNVSRSICSRLMKLRRTLLETHTLSATTHSLERQKLSMALNKENFARPNVKEWVGRK